MTPGELFGAPEKKAKKKKERSANTDAVLRLEAAYCEAFEARWKFKPRRSYGRDRKHFSDLEQTWGEDEVMAIIGAFFATADFKVVRSDYSVGALYALAQHVRLLARRSVGDDRTLANIDAAARATGRKR